MIRVLLQIALLVSGLALVSCSPFRAKEPEQITGTEPKRSLFSRLPSLPKPKMPDLSLARFLPGPKIKVVEPREKDLKELPMGSELAASRRGYGFADFWSFSDKLYFEEPNFPEPGLDMDGSLLPPKAP